LNNNTTSLVNISMTTTVYLEPIKIVKLSHVAQRDVLPIQCHPDVKQIDIIASPHKNIHIHGIHCQVYYFKRWEKLNFFSLELISS